MGEHSTAVFLGWRDSRISDQIAKLVAGGYEVLEAREIAFGEPIDQEEIAPDGVDYLFSFGPLIVRAPLLHRVERAAINFHSGPPRWPGRGSISFALLEGDTEFGVTAHLMVEEIDQGPILRVIRFPILADDDVAAIDGRTKSAIVDLTRLVLADLDANGGQPCVAAEQWERPALTQADLLRRMEILPTDDDETIARKVRAFAHPTKPGPYIEVGGHRFWYLGNDKPLA
jgi:methionyl-tRNA formyltransferase